MTKQSGVSRLREACRRGTTKRLLEKYIASCRGEDEQDHSGSRVGKKETRVPNLAGFCRYMKIGTEELDALAKDFPEEIDGLYAILEDEALNCSLPAAILSVYLKKRLGYDGEAGRQEGEGETVNIRFEHDVYRDGA